ncbi:MAG: response regulator [Gammaproteobacteria bacterium]|nr:response regulator [Gammaproteobacteria bacterium]
MDINKKILVVDDNLDFCENLIDILELREYEVRAVHDGLQALEAVTEEHFDLVLMDIKMPAMNGVDAFKRIKEIDPLLPVIMMSAYALEELISEALREGAFSIIHKPFDFDKLFRIIDNALLHETFLMLMNSEPETAAALHDTLLKQGRRLVRAETEDDAMRLARENKFDIIVIDMNLPALNGLETYLRIHAIRPDTKALIVTNHPGEVDEFACQVLGNNAYVCLEKPLDMAHLQEILHKVLASPSKIEKAS